MHGQFRILAEVLMCDELIQDQDRDRVGLDFRYVIVALDPAIFCVILVLVLRAWFLKESKRPTRLQKVFNKLSVIFLK